MSKAIIVGSVLLLAACNYYHPKGLSTEAGGGGTDKGPRRATFQTMTASFFKPYCYRCHKGPAPRGGANLETLQAMVDADVLVPGFPEKSSIYTEVRDGAMPENPPMPPAELTEALRLWISDGAPEK